VKRALLAVLICLLAGCGTKAASPGGTASSSSSSGQVASSSDQPSASDLPSATPSAVAAAAADAKQACGAFEDLIKDLTSSPPLLNFAVTAAGTLSSSSLGASTGDPAHWQHLSDDLDTLLKSLTAGGTIKAPAANDPALLAVRADCR
jgi:hypothetical protein